MLDFSDPMDQLVEQLERVKAGIRARVEHTVRVVKRLFGHAKVRYTRWLHRSIFGWFDAN